MFGGQAETIKFAQAVDNMNKQSSELGKSVEGTKGNFDAFTSAGFDLYNQITTNSASLLEMNGNSKDVANYMKNTIEQFKKGAKAAEYTDDEVTDLLNSLGLISGLAEITIQIDIDLIEAKKTLAGFLKALSSVHLCGRW
jgi:archaellum component FlaC